MTPDERTQLTQLNRRSTDQLRNEYTKLANQMSWYLRGTFAIILLGAILFSLLLWQNSQRADETKTIAVQARHLAEQNRHITQRIEQDRIQTVVLICEDNNTRNQSSVATLNKVIDQVERGKTEAQVKAIEAAREQNVLLINALAPFRKDCPAYAHSVVKPVSP